MAGVSQLQRRRHGGAARRRRPNRGSWPAFSAYLTQDDGWIAAFCDAEGYDYTAPMAARRALAGGEAPEWT